jgi:hypothetical protein
LRYSYRKAYLKKDLGVIRDICLNNLKDIPEERFSWIYENNPHGSPVCWLVEDTEKDMAVGTAALFPRRMMIQGKTGKGGIAGDFAINKHHRGLGPALSLQKKLFLSVKEDNYDVLYGIPNEQSLPILVRAGYKVIGNNLWMNKSIQSHHFLKHYIKSKILIKILSRPLDIIMRFVSRETYYNKPQSFSFHTLNSFDNRFDDLWNRVSEKYTIIGERTSDYLNWKYIENPYRSHDIFVIVQNETSEILGYIVSHTSQNSVHIVDMLTLNLEEVFDSLLTEFILFQRKKGINAIKAIYFGNNDIVMKLNKYRFFITNRQKVIAYKNSELQTLSCMLDESNWYLMKGDDDV